jgi:cyclase
MRKARVIPCLLVKGNGLVKTKKFKDPVYVGDPINTMRIFSDKEVDEIVVLDIDASKTRREPNYELIAEMAGEAFMPMAYGGGVTSVEQVRQLIRCGIEKVVLNSAAIRSQEWIRNAVRIFGSQAIVGAVDVKKTLLGGYRVVTRSATEEADLDLDAHVANLIAAGVGEILVNSVDCDGMMTGYDLPLIRRIAKLVNVPIVACGGAGTVKHLAEGVQSGASAVAAGSMFVFHGKHRAVLISYIEPKDATHFLF